MLSAANVCQINFLRRIWQVYVGNVGGQVFLLSIIEMLENFSSAMNINIDGIFADARSSC